MSNGIMSFHKKLLSPRGFAFLLLFPLNIMVPLVIASFVWGIPYPYYKNNSEINKFEKAFETIALAESTAVVGLPHSFIGNLVDNIKADELLKKQQAADASEDSDMPAGSFGESNLGSILDEKEEEIFNGCDLFAGKIIETELDDATVREVLQDNFAGTVKALEGTKEYELTYLATLSLVPINSESLVLDINNFRVDILKDFEILDKSKIDFENKAVYLMYLLSDNVNKSNDPRCK